MVKTSRPANPLIDTLIGAGTLLEGDITFNNSIRVDGKVVGNITASDQEKSTVVIGKAGRVEGRVQAPHIIVNGEIDGEIHCQGTIDLATNAKISGKIQYRHIQIADGAIISGEIKTLPETPMEKTVSQLPSSSR